MSTQFHRLRQTLAFLWSKVRARIPHLFVVALMAPLLAQALTCEPKSALTPNGAGSRIVERVTPIGDWRYIWCPVPGKVYTDGKVAAWALERHVVLAKYRAEPKTLASVLWSMAAAPSPLDAMNAALKAGEIPPSGPQEAYEMKLLRYQACQDAATPPYIVDVAPLPADYCGQPPAPMVLTWMVAPNAASITDPPTRPMWDATGAKAVTERAVVGVTCNCAAPVPKGAQVLCRIQGSASVNLTACVRQP